MTEKEMIDQVAKELGHDKEVVKFAYRSMYKFIIDKIRALPLDINMTKEEFDKLRTNFSLMDIGKLYCVWDNIQKKKRFREVINNSEYIQKKYGRKDSE